MQVEDGLLDELSGGLIEQKQCIVVTGALEEQTPLDEGRERGRRIDLVHMLGVHSSTSGIVCRDRDPGEQFVGSSLNRRFGSRMIGRELSLGPGIVESART